MEHYSCEGQLICIIYRDADWVPGLNFITPNDLAVQVGSWWYQKGKALDPHSHKTYERCNSLTMEMVYVKKGAMLLNLFNNADKLIEKIKLLEGDTAVLCAGGHGYEILEDNTQVIEAKNGPFLSAELDKKRFST
jgi:hypothetical protein